MNKINNMKLFIPCLFYMAIGSSIAEICPFRGKEFLVLGRHQWRFTARLSFTTESNHNNIITSANHIENVNR